MKAKKFLEQVQDVVQVVPTPFSVDSVKSEFMKKQAEFGYIGISVEDVKFGPEGTVLILRQDNVISAVTFSYKEDVGPFAEIKPGAIQPAQPAPPAGATQPAQAGGYHYTFPIPPADGGIINLDLTPLSPPLIDTPLGKQIDVSSMTWLTKEAFEGIASAANLKPVETPPEPPLKDLGSVGSGAATPTSEQPKSPPMELDAKTVPAPTIRAPLPSTLPGESLYSDGKSRYYPGIDMEVFGEQEREDIIVQCRRCKWIGSEREIRYDADDVPVCPKCGSFEVGDVRESLKEQKLKSEDPKSGPKALKAFFTMFPDKKRGEYKYTFEHNQLWIVGIGGDQYSVEDATGPETVDGFNFELVKEKEESHHETKISDLSPAIQHQIKIAQKTLRMPDAMVGVMGGMTKEQAREILKKYGMLPKSEESLRSDGTSKYHPGLKREALHRVVFQKGKETGMIDIEAGSDEEARRKAKDKLKPDQKILVVGKHVKEHLRGDHKLKIISLDDAQAECSAGDWQYSFTGPKTREEIEADFEQWHLKNIPESKELTLFRFAFREGKRIKIPVGKVREQKTETKPIRKVGSWKVEYQDKRGEWKFDSRSSDIIMANQRKRELEDKYADVRVVKESYHEQKKIKKDKKWISYSREWAKYWRKPKDDSGKKPKKAQEFLKKVRE